MFFKKGLTALHFAADRGFLEIARLLVEAGADIAALDEDEQTPLDYAVLCEQHEVTAYLRSISGGAIEPSKWFQVIPDDGADVLIEAGHPRPLQKAESRQTPMPIDIEALLGSIYLVRVV